MKEKFFLFESDGSMRRDQRELSRLGGNRREPSPSSGRADSVIDLRPFVKDGYRVLGTVDADQPGTTQWSIADVLAVVRRRKWLIASTTCALVAAAATFSFMATPLYTAEGLLLLSTPKTHITDVKAVITGPPLEVATVRSEIEVLKSPAMAEKVTDALELWNEPVYRPDPRPPLLERMGLPAISLADIRDWLGWPAEANDDASIEPDSPRKSIASALSATLDPVFDGRSYVVRLRFSSPDRELAARIVNAFMEIDLAEQLTINSETTRKAKGWLQARLSELKEQTEQADKAAETYRAAHHLSDPRGVALTAQQLSELNTQLVLASTERAQKENALRQIRELPNSPAGIGSAGQVLASPLVQRLSELETEVQRNLADATQVYGEKHPAVIKLRSQRAEIRRRLDAEMGKIAYNLANELAIAKGREDDLRTRLASVQGEHNQLGEAEVRLRELQRQADVTRRIYETFLTRELELRGQEKIEQADARIVSFAQPPLRPSYPNKPAFIALSIAAGVTIGLFLAFLSEALDRTFRKMSDLETEAGLLPLGFVPAVNKPEKKFMELAGQPRSGFAEAVRSIRTALAASGSEKPPQLVLITSASSGEGKSVIAASLARSVAQGGRRCLLVECDLRRPSIARLMRDKVTHGIAELLEGRCSSVEAIRRDHATGMDYIACSERRQTASPQDLIGSAAMQRFLAEARTMYDVIVVDAPPVLAVSDPIILSRFADATVLVVRWRGTRREAVRAAVEALRVGGCIVTGAVLSQVDLRKQAKLGFFDRTYYHREHVAYHG